MNLHRLLALSALAAAVACGKGTSMTATTPASDAWFDVRYLSERAGRPPVRYLDLELTLRNRADHPRWFLVPSMLTTTWSRPEGGVSSVEVRAYRGAGAGKVIAGTFLGNAGFVAIKLPARAEVTLHHYGVSLWEDGRPKSAPFEVTAADAVTVEGGPIEKWFEGDPTSDAGAVVDTNEMISSHPSADGNEAKVEVTGAERRKVDLALP